jgi:Xaa-Pro aminopeptidase
LAGVLLARGLRGAVLSRREHVYWLTGFLCHRHQAAAAFLDQAGRVVLAGAGVLDGLAVDEILAYTPSYRATLHSRQHEAVAEALAGAIPRGGPWGADLGGGAACVTALAGPDAADITPDLVRLRQRKSTDEVACIRTAIGVTQAMYAAARLALRPGLDELELFCHLRAVATSVAGGDLEFLGNDFQANSPGGLPRRRPMQAGELYILDAGPAVNGYFADNCRTFSVDRDPSPAQWRAWRALDSLFPLIEAAIRPGIEAAVVFQLADEQLRQQGYAGMVHHLGHGVGLAPHEGPQLNPDYPAVFAVGDVFTVEPGLYAEDLRAGIRLEENYLLTATGVERLTDFPRDLF